MWVIQNTDNGKFVAPPGSAKGHTNDLRKAQTYNLRPSPAELCWNEKAVRVSDLLVTPI